MVRRVCGRDFGPKRNIVVLNDEAHHCYRGNPKHEEVPPPTGLDADTRDEIKENTKAARAWISGLEFVQSRLGVKAVYDLSATPFFLRGSGYSEGTLFPWVISDFSLVEAIEAGIVKIPRVPVADDALSGDQPTYRNLWLRIREELPKKGRATEAAKAEPTLPKELEGALFSLYYDYEKRFEEWKNNAEAQARGLDRAGLHRGLQQHERIQDGLRFHLRVGEGTARCGWQRCAAEDRSGRQAQSVPQ